MSSLDDDDEDEDAEYLDEDEPELPADFAVAAYQLKRLFQLIDDAMDMLDPDDPEYVDLHKARWALDRLPEIPTTGWLDLTIGREYSHGNVAGVTNEWVEVRLSRDELRFTSGANYYDPDVGGDTAVDETLVCDRYGDAEGDLDDWLDLLENVSSGTVKASVEGFEESLVLPIANPSAAVSEVVSIESEHALEDRHVQTHGMMINLMCMQSALEQGLCNAARRGDAIDDSQSPALSVAVISAFISGFIWLIGGNIAWMLPAACAVMCALSALEHWYVVQARLSASGAEITAILGVLTSAGCTIDWQRGAHRRWGTPSVTYPDLPIPKTATPGA
jgi:hypothetical protein